MASLIDELISILEEECDIYQRLIPIAEEKTRVIVKNDLSSLQEITAREQAAVGSINTLERKREHHTDFLHYSLLPLCKYCSPATSLCFE